VGLHGDTSRRRGDRTRNAHLVTHEGDSPAALVGRSLGRCRPAGGAGSGSRVGGFRPARDLKAPHRVVPSRNPQPEGGTVYRSTTSGAPQGSDEQAAYILAERSLFNASNRSGVQASELLRHHPG